MKAMVMSLLRSSLPQNETGQTRWSEEVSKCWELQIPKSPLVGPHNDAPEADVVARKGSGAPNAEGTRGNAMQQASGPGGNLGAGLNRVLRSSYSGPHGIPRGIYSTWGLSVLGMYSGEGQRDQVWFYKLCELGTPLSFFKPQSPDL